MIYTCDICNKTYDHKGNFEAHIRRKNNCSFKRLQLQINQKNEPVNEVIHNNPNNPNIIQNLINNPDNNPDIIKTFDCVLCSKKFKYVTGLDKHKRKHKKYDEEVKNNKDNIISTMQKNIDEILRKDKERDELIKQLQEENVALKKIKGSKKITNNNTTNNTNNTTNNNIVIVKFGSENIESLSQEDLKKLLFTPNANIMYDCVQMIHFNEKLPDQNNIKCTNTNPKFTPL
jgi:hypothetical protein